ncbi:MAG TPA: Maf family protein [Eoetvoesiella sp.]
MSSTSPLIYLASASPRRHEILLQMGIAHQILKVPSPPGEDEPRLPNETPEHYVCRTAKDKALRAVDWISTQALPCAPILSADTTVILNNDILGKPVDQNEARQMLERLSGATHFVHTAVVLAHAGQAHEDVSITEVRMKRLSKTEIDAYCATGEPMGKAGSYGIQGAAAFFIEHISGSYSGVMGLPIFETYRLLQQCSVRSSIFA